MKLQTIGGTIEPVPNSLIAGFGLMWIFLILFQCVVWSFAIFSVVILILSLVDVIKRENWKNENDKILWIILILFVPFAHYYYYFVERKKSYR